MQRNPPSSGNGVLSYRLVRERRRSIGIYVGLDGVSVKAPRWVSEKSIDDFVRSKSDWIEKRLSKSREAVEGARASGAYERIVPYMGGSVPIKVLDAGSREGARFDGSSFTFRARDRGRGNVERLYTRWLRRNAGPFFEQRIDVYKGILGVEPVSLSVRNQKSRWGSASKSGSISLNCNLMKAPTDIIDYVVVHELAHMRVADHSKEFWKVVESVIPDYKKKRKWLRENGVSLMDSSKKPGP